MKNKPKIYAISYGNDLFSMSRKLNLFTAKLIGRADYVRAFSPEDLDETFKHEFADVLEVKRGAGLWAWKPYIILKMLETVKDGDFVMYSDAGTIYVNRITELTRQLDRDNKDIFLSSGIAPCKDWCKRDAFVLMECDTEEAYNAIMVSGGYVLVRNTLSARKFLNEWLNYSKDVRIISDEKNRCGYENCKGFRENRHDQTILSLLAWKYQIEPYKAVSHVDEPRAFKDVYEKCTMSAYKYSFHKCVDLMYREHLTEGYKRSDYSRIFVNTRVKNSSLIHFVKDVFKAIVKAIETDRWGKKNDTFFLSRAEERSKRQKGIAG